MLGMSDTVFGADQPLTRGMIVTVLYRLESEPKVMGTQFFKDVAPDAWYAEAVGWAAERGIVFGYGNGVFGPQDDITREQLAAILYRYAQFKGYDVSVGEDTNILSWNDAFTISDWANSAMRWACGCGIYGDDDPILRPVEPATRGEIAGAIRVFLENVAK